MPNGSIQRASLIVGILVGVMGFPFGAWQSMDSRAVERGQYQASVKQLIEQVGRLETSILELRRLVHEQQQIEYDLRARLADLERITREAKQVLPKSIY